MATGITTQRRAVHATQDTEVFLDVALGHASVAFTHARYERPAADADEPNRKSLENL